MKPDTVGWLNRVRESVSRISPASSIGTYCIASSVVILCLLLVLVPSALAGAASVKVILPLAALAGALGASIHMLTSFSVFAGQKELRKEWAWWYYLRPLIGASLGALFVLALEGAGVGGESAQVDPATHLAVAGLAGLFSKQAIEWLKELFDRVLKGFTKRETDGAKPAPEEPKVQPSEEQRRPAKSAATAIWLASFVVVFAFVLILMPAVASGNGWFWSRAAQVSEGATEMQFLLTMALCAMMGSLASMPVTRSLRARRVATSSDTDCLWPAALRPFVAASLAILVYFLSRGFLFHELPIGTKAYALTSAAVLVGLFTNQGISWLSGIADTLFQKAPFEEGRDR